MDTHTDTTPSAHQSRSPETWAGAREDYLAAAAAPEVCARYGIPLSTFRDWAKKEGWRRADQADPAPFDYAAELDENGDPPGPGELAEDAWEGLVRTLRQDRPREAHAWLRLHRALLQFEAEVAERAAFAAPRRAPSRPTAPAPSTAARPPTLEEIGELDGRS